MEEKNTKRPADRIKALAQWYIDHKVFRGMKTFEEACGLSFRYVKNLCLTVHGNPGVETIAQIYCTFKCVDLHWLVLGEGKMFTCSDEEAISAAIDATHELKKQEKIKSVLNSSVFKGMTREEKLELMQRVLDGEV